MNEALRIQLEWYMRHGLNELTGTQLVDYEWHVEQQLQAVRQEQLQRRPSLDLGIPLHP